VARSAMKRAFRAATRFLEDRARVQIEPKDERPRICGLSFVARGRCARWSTLISWDFRVELVA
jgi:hypothetical protein